MIVELLNLKSHVALNVLFSKGREKRGTLNVSKTRRGVLIVESPCFSIVLRQGS
jgi:hypothetical protein